MSYSAFLEQRTQLGRGNGIEPVFMPDAVFPFQRDLITWALQRGRAALYEDCGLGKSLQSLTWGENIVRHTNKPVLLLTPLAVGHQMIREAAKFGMEAVRSGDGKLGQGAKIYVTNYERLHYFDRSDFAGVICDEAGILKNYDGVTRDAVVEFMRKMPFRLLCTATPAPNDFIELGNSSEALGELGFMDMLSRFFKKAEATSTRADEFRSGKWRFRGHAQREFWRWVCSWARAIRKPSDMGYDDELFTLPPLTYNEHVVDASVRPDGFLFSLPAVTLQEQRHERRETLQERCEKAASLVADTGKPAIAWCHLNDEGNLLEKLIPGAVEVDGKDADELKEERFDAFERGEIRVLISKPSVAGWGLNWQHCSHQTYFPSHSFEQMYQGVRRSWRFGQKNPVVVDVVTSEGERGVLQNLQRKAAAAEEMLSSLVSLMNDELHITKVKTATKPEQIPSWLSPIK